MDDGCSRAAAPRSWIAARQLTVEESSPSPQTRCGEDRVYRLGEEKLYDYMTRFGFGQPTGVTLDGEIRGWVKPWQKVGMGSRFSRIPIGHAITTTPAAMAMAMSASPTRAG